MNTGLNPVLLATLAVLNAPLYYLAYRVIFKDWEEFTEAVWFWLKPDLWTHLRVTVRGAAAANENVSAKFLPDGARIIIR